MARDEIYSYEPLWGEWKVEEKIGKGGFASVYKISRKLGNQRLYSAVKHISIRKNKLETNSFDFENEDIKNSYFDSIIRLIENEIKILHDLRGNSYIVSYEDYLMKEKPQNTGWDILIRMELLEPLPNYIKKNNITFENILNISIDICKALEICNRNNIIHRDIKEDNIFVSPNGNFKLGDFSIAKILTENSNANTQTGTPYYLAPEVYNRQNYDNRVDIYTLGLVFYKLVNNLRFPFLPNYPNEINFNDYETAFLKRVSGNEIEKPTNIPNEMWIILKTSLSYKADGRYKDVVEMKKELESAKNNISQDILSKVAILNFIKEKNQNSKNDTNSNIVETAEVSTSNSSTITFCENKNDINTVHNNSNIESTMLVSNTENNTPKLNSKKIIIFTTIAILVGILGFVFIKFSSLPKKDVVLNSTKTLNLLTSQIPTNTILSDNLNIATNSSNLQTETDNSKTQTIISVTPINSNKLASSNAINPKENLSSPPLTSIIPTKQTPSPTKSKLFYLSYKVVFSSNTIYGSDNVEITSPNKAHITSIAIDSSSPVNYYVDYQLLLRDSVYGRNIWTQTASSGGFVAYDVNGNAINTYSNTVVGIKTGFRYAPGYHLEYRALQNGSWTNWCKDKEFCGSESTSAEGFTGIQFRVTEY